MDGQQRSRKKYGAVPPFQILLQVCRRIYAQQLQFKTSLPFQFRINRIIFIQDVINIQKIPDLEIKLQNLLPFLRILAFLQEAFQFTEYIHQFQSNMGNTFHDLISRILFCRAYFVQYGIIFTFPLHLQKQPVALLQPFCQPGILCFHKTFHLQDLFFIYLRAVHLPSTLHQIVRLINQEQIAPLVPL